jgi:hypothetical protein
MLLKRAMVNYIHEPYVCMHLAVLVLRRSSFCICACICACAFLFDGRQYCLCIGVFLSSESPRLNGCLCNV